MWVEIVWIRQQIRLYLVRFIAIRMWEFYHWEDVRETNPVLIRADAITLIRLSQTQRYMMWAMYTSFLMSGSVSVTWLWSEGGSRDWRQVRFSSVSLSSCVLSATEMSNSLCACVSNRNWRPERCFFWCLDFKREKCEREIRCLAHETQEGENQIWQDVETVLSSFQWICVSLLTRSAPSCMCLSARPMQSLWGKAVVRNGKTENIRRQGGAKSVKKKSQSLCKRIVFQSSEQCRRNQRHFMMNSKKENKFSSWLSCSTDFSGGTASHAALSSLKSQIDKSGTLKGSPVVLLMEPLKMLPYEKGFPVTTQRTLFFGKSKCSLLPWTILSLALTTPLIGVSTCIVLFRFILSFMFV